MGRQIAEASLPGRTTGLQLELKIVGFESERPPGTDASIYEDAIAAYRTGVTQWLATTEQQVANAWAARFTDDQLKPIAAFLASPEGKARMQRGDALNVALEQAGAVTRVKIGADARQIYCAAHDCIDASRSHPPSVVSPAASTRTP